MRKLIRAVVIVVAVFVLLVIAVRVFVPADKWMTLAFDQLHARTGLRASAQDASVSFPWPIGIKLVQLTVEGPEGRPAAARLKGSAGEVLVTADLGSILRRKPQIQEVRLKQPDFEVWLPEPAAPDSAAAPASPSPSGQLPPNAALAVGLLSVEHGRVVVHGPGGRETRVEGIEQRARLRLQESGMLTGTLNSDLGKLVLKDPARPQEFTLEKLATELRVEADVRAKKGTVTIAQLSVWGSSVRGPVAFELGGDQPTLQGKLAVEADVPTVMEALKGFMPPPKPGVEIPQVKAGTLRGELRIAGSLPAQGAPPDAALALLAGEGEVSGLRVSAMGRDDLLGGAMKWALANGKLQLDGIDARLPGVEVTGAVNLPANGLGDVRGKLALKVDVGATVALVKELWPRLPAAARAGKQDPSLWPGVAGRLQGNVDLKLPIGRPLDPQLTPIAWDAQLGRLAIANPSLPDSVRVLAGKAAGTMLKADFYNIEVEGPGMKGKLNGGLTGWPARIELTGTGEFSKLDLDAMVPTAQPARPDQRKAWLQGVLPEQARAAQGGATTGELPKPPENFAARFVVRADELRTRGYRAQELLARGVLEKQVMHVSTLHAKMGTGSIDGIGGVDWTTPTPTWSIDATADAIPSSEVFGPVAGSLAQALNTKLSGAIKLSGPVTADPVAVQAQLSGDCKVQSSDGQLQTQPLLGDQLASLLGATEAKRFAVLDFKRLSTALQMRDGKVQFDDLLLDGPTSVAAKGTIGMVDHRVDYGLTVRLPAGVTPDLGAFSSFASLLRDDQGRITVSLRVSGPANKPKIELDLAQVQQRVKQGGENALKDKLKQLLPSGLGAKDSSGTSAPGQGQAAIDSVARQKAGDAVKDLLGGLRKKKGNTP